MKHSQSKTILLVTVVALLFVLSESVAANIQIKLVKPEKFRDIDIAGYSQKKTISIVEKELHQLFSQISKEYINQDQKLSIEVLDVDLAGYIEYFWGSTNREIRLIRDNDRYRMKFRFELKDSNNKVLQSGEKSIQRFANLRQGRMTKGHNERFVHFEKILKHWFEKEFVN